MAISHEARKKLDLILNKHYDGDLLTQQALNDIIAVFDGEVNSGPVVQHSETFKNNEQTGNNERRLQIATQLLAGMLASIREFENVGNMPTSDKLGRASERCKIALLHADRMIEMAEAK